MTQTNTKAAAEPKADEQPKAAAAPAADKPKAAARPKALSTKAILAAINDGDGDPELVAALNKALYLFGAQDPSLELPRSWQRVQRRIGLDPEKPIQDRLDGVATADEVARFAARAGLKVTD